jgi:hypothetical protein
MRPWILCLLSSLLPLAAAGGSLFPDDAEVNGARFPKMGEHRTTYKVAILQSADHMLRKNLSAETRESIAQLTAQLHAKYRTVERGDRSSLTYVPGRGTTFALNQQPQITIPGQAFARHYLDIWLGERPISVALRDQLLAQ